MTIKTDSGKTEEGRSNKVILVVEDETNLREFYLAALGDDYKVVTSSSGQDAIKHLGSGVDLVILDCKLPDMTGIDVLGKIRDSSRVPVLIVTGCEDDRVCEELTRHGARDYLTKPFRVRDLIRKVNAYLPLNDGGSRKKN